jgi:hypothetical protein
MAMMGLALPWEIRISSVLRERETRVEPAEQREAAPGQAVALTNTEDAALAAAWRLPVCRAICVRTNVSMRSTARA